MLPMFSIPQVTWASQTMGQAAVGKFPNPKSVMKICKYPHPHLVSTVSCLLFPVRISVNSKVNDRLTANLFIVVWDRARDRAVIVARSIDANRGQICKILYRITTKL